MKHMMCSCEAHSCVYMEHFFYTLMCTHFLHINVFKELMDVYFWYSTWMCTRRKKSFGFSALKSVKSIHFMVRPVLKNCYTDF